MNALILIKTAFRAIARHKGRSFLTVLGIMIGVAAITVTFSIGRGAEERIRSQILTMGEGAAYIIPGNVITRGAVRSSLAKPVSLTESDMFAIRDQIPEIKEIPRYARWIVNHDLREIVGVYALLPDPHEVSRSGESVKAHPEIVGEGLNTKVK